jgi:DNA-binding CsgD family transcriptional regulator
MSKIKDEDEKIISGELNNSERIYNGINAAGERAHIKIFKTPLKSKDHIIGIIGIGIDITEEYITEEILIQKGIWTLAPLEKTYLFMMARGRTRKQIYRELNISEVQGDKIKSNLIRKLDLNGKPDEIPYLLRAYCKILRSIE